NQSCSSCDQVDTFENILDHFCRSDYVFKVKVHALGRNALQVKRGKAFKVKSPQNVQNFPLNGLKLKLTDGGDENNNETPCPCNVLSQDRSLEKRYLVMANRTSSGDYVLNLVLPWKKDKMRAKRMFHKLDCKTLGTRIRERARRERTKMLTTQAAAGSSPQRHTRRPPPTNQNGFSTPAPSGRRRNNGNGQKNHRQKTPPTAPLAAKNGLRTSGQQHRQRKIEDEKLLAQHDRRNHHRHHHNQNGRKNRKNSAAKNGRQTNRSLEDTFL
uniref:NTR domain-containing protein n=1 Tax=Romanomermis culicivorax TaxID=13658 RepID=A0A915IIG0_ROMCU